MWNWRKVAKNKMKALKLYIPTMGYFHRCSLGGSWSQALVKGLHTMSWSSCCRTQSKPPDVATTRTRAGNKKSKLIWHHLFTLGMNATHSLPSPLNKNQPPCLAQGTFAMKDFDCSIMFHCLHTVRNESRLCRGNCACTISSKCSGSLSHKWLSINTSFCCSSSSFMNLHSLYASKIGWSPSALQPI